MKGLCVGEARSHGGEPPMVLHVDRVVRSFTPPDQVRAGADEYGVIQRMPVQKINCHYPPIRKMIAEDEARRGREG
ncbi:MAG: hypothetical protein R3B09_22475 [Nannocystaceae bacterium]